MSWSSEPSIATVIPHSRILCYSDASTGSAGSDLFKLKRKNFVFRGLITVDDLVLAYSLIHSAFPGFLLPTKTYDTAGTAL